MIEITKAQAIILHEESMSNHDFRRIAEFAGINKSSSPEKIIEFHESWLAGLKKPEEAKA